MNWGQITEGAFWIVALTIIAILAGPRSRAAARVWPRTFFSGRPVAAALLAGWMFVGFGSWVGVALMIVLTSTHLMNGTGVAWMVFAAGFVAAVVALAWATTRARRAVRRAALQRRATRARVAPAR